MQWSYQTIRKLLNVTKKVKTVNMIRNVNEPTSEVHKKTTAALMSCENVREQQRTGAKYVVLGVAVNKLFPPYL